MVEITQTGVEEEPEGNHSAMFMALGFMWTIIATASITVTVGVLGTAASFVAAAGFFIAGLLKRRSKEIRIEY